MIPSPAIRKVFQGVANRPQLFRMFDRHAQRANRWNGDAAPFYSGEWFEIGETSAVGETDYASLARCAQYAQFTPGYVIRAIWAGLQ